MTEQDHYEAIADSYEDAYFYQSATDYHRWLVEQCLDVLDLGPEDRLADIGCGTGHFTAALARAAGLTIPALAIDSSPSLLEAAAARSELRVLQADALAFAHSESRPSAPIDAVLLKEVIHHLPREQLPDLAFGLYQRLSFGGRILIVTRPKTVDYPFFAAAHRVWEAHQDEAVDYAATLQDAGFQTAIHLRPYPIALPKDQWFAMIRKRFWSTFARFSDEELEAGIAEIERAHPGDNLSFDDRLLFLIARKN